MTELTDDVRDRRMRRRRWILFVPVGLLALLCVVWSIGWLVIRSRAEASIDGWFAREAQLGRTWICPDRSVAGFPFRIEVVCGSVGFERSDLAFTLGRVLAVAQVYQPSRVIIEITGPFRLTRGAVTAQVNWTLFQASIEAALQEVQRLSVVIDAPSGTIDGLVLAPNPVPVPVTFSGRHLEIHGRPTPGRFESDGAVDLSVRADAMALPLLDPVLGGAEPADIALDATANRARGFGARPLPVEFERWRQDGGTLDLTLLSFAKGPRRLQLRGTLSIDEGHRLAGRLDAQAAGLEAVIGPILGQRFGGERGALIGGLIGQILGGGRARPRDGAAQIDQPGADTGPTLRPLPPVRLDGGRLFLGPIGLPVALLPLY